MFNEILLFLNDRRYHRFLWRPDKNEPIRVGEWLRLLFGDTPSPDLAINAIHMLADECQESCPDAATVLKEKTYMDDIGASFKISRFPD